jgi:hypothetical protein
MTEVLASQESPDTGPNFSKRYKVANVYRASFGTMEALLATMVSCCLFWSFLIRGKPTYLINKGCDMWAMLVSSWVGKLS